MLTAKAMSTTVKLVTDKDMRYSTDEVKTGATWIDGKPIYRRVFKVTNKSLSNGTLVQGFAKSNFDAIVSIYVFCRARMADTYLLHVLEAREKAPGSSTRRVIMALYLSDLIHGPRSPLDG